MLPEEDEAPQSDHSVEVELDSPFPPRRRRIAQVAVAAVLLGAAGLIAFAVTEHHRAVDNERALEDAQSTQLKDGWKTLGAIAAQDARSDNTQAAAQPTAAPTVVSVPAPATTNIVIVNSPAQPEQRSGSGTSAPAVPNVVVPTPAVASGTSSGSNTVYVPTPVLPQVGTGNIPGQNVSNGSNPGSVPNPALPNGSVNGPTVPGQSNGTTMASPNEPSTPVGSVPASPPTMSGSTP